MRIGSSLSGKVLVTGATGFVGRHLLAALADGGFEAVATSRAGGGVGALDVADGEAVRRVIADVRPDAVVHLAAIAHGGRGRVTADDYDRVNHRGTAHVVAACEEAGVRLVAFSSASVYGDAERTEPVAEDAVLRPVGPYARSKADAETHCTAALERGLRVAVLRFPAIYAPEWLLDVRKRAYLPGTGNRVLLRVAGRPPRFSLCAVDNAVAAVLAGLDGRFPPGVFNVADPVPYTQAEVSDVVGRLDGASRRVVLPRAAAKVPLGVAAALLPGERGAAVRSHYWKLFEGLVLDTSRMDAAGVGLSARLADLLSERR